MAVANPAKKWSDGKAILLDLTSAVDKGDLAYVNGWLAIANEAGSSGDTIGGTIEDFEYVFHVGASLSVSKGQIVYVDITALTGHKPTLANYATAANTNLIRAFKATTDKDANNYVRGRFLGGYHLS